MHPHLKNSLLISAFIISLTLALSLVFAAVAEVNLVPTQTSPNKVTDFSFSVKNLGGDNINRVELVVPQINNVPSYAIREIGNPAGWTYESRYSVGAQTPFKIIWSTGSSGISSGQSLNFNFAVSAPDAGADYNFEWKAVDLKGVEISGKIKVINFNPILSSFAIRTTGSPIAGKETEMTIVALDQNGNIKTDYTGTVKFSTSDSSALVPSDYTFQLAENGVKVFKIKLKTAGEQDIKVVDGSVSKSIKVNVQQGDVSYIRLNLSSGTIASDSVVTFNVISSDLYGNMKDVTKDSQFSVDSQAKGAISTNTYKAEVPGKWTVVATYMGSGKQFSDGRLLTVSTESPKVEAQRPEEKVGLEIVSDDLIDVAANTTKTFSITVRNTGDDDLSNVSLYFTGFPDKSLSISPAAASISKGKLQRFEAKISSPDRVDLSNVEFLALSGEYPSEKLNASKTIKINVTESTPEKASSSVTGKIGVSKNLTYLGIAIIVAIVLIVLFWLLFLKEEDTKKKKAEKAEKME